MFDNPRVVLVEQPDELRAVSSEYDLVLFDAPAHGDLGTDALVAHLRRSRVSIAVFTDRRCINEAIEFFRFGALGYLSKNTDSTRLREYVSALLRGERVLDATLGGELAFAVSQSSGLTWPGMSNGLTPREGEVLSLLQRGLTNREIAERLIIGLQTVKTHAHTIYRKLGVDSRSELLI